MDEEISFRNDSDSMRMVRRSNPAVWTSALDDLHISTSKHFLYISIMTTHFCQMTSHYGPILGIMTSHFCISLNGLEDNIPKISLFWDRLG